MLRSVLLNLCVTAALAGFMPLSGCQEDPVPPAAATPPPTSSPAVSDEAAETMERLRRHPAMQEAFQTVLDIEPRTLADHITLTEIPAPPFGEGPRAEVFAGMLAASGADSVWIDPVGNVIARIDGRERARTIAFGAHLDTVFPAGTDVRVRMQGDTLYAPGIGDDTRGLAVLLAMMRTVEARQLAFEDDVLLIGTVGEEGLGDLRGVRHLFGPEGLAIHEFIAIDGGRLGNVINQALGSNRYRVTVEGQGGHSWGAFGNANPQHALASIVHFFVEKADPFTANGPKTSYNIGRVEGGTSVNAIPEKAWMEVDMRSVNPDRLAGIDVLLQQSIEEGLTHQNSLKRRGEALTVNVESIGKRPSGETSADHPLVQRALAGARSLGGDANLSISSTDANIPISLGIPAITIGRGGEGGNAHALNEWWINREGHLGIQWALLLMASQAHLVTDGD